MSNEENTIEENITEETVTEESKNEEILAEQLAVGLAEGEASEEAQESEGVEESEETEASEKSEESEEAQKSEEPEEAQKSEETEVSEEETVVEEKKKLSKTAIALIITGAVLLVALIAGYFVVSAHYQKRFFMSTSVNDVDCSNLTIQDVEAILQKQVEEYNLTIVKSDGTSEEIKGTDIGIQYIGYNQLKEAFEKQNAYLWPKALFVGTDIEVEVVFDYSREKLEEKIGQLECMNPENQVAPVAATVVFRDGAFVIQEETYGTQIDSAKLVEAAHASVLAIDTEMNLEEAGCYVQPKYTKDSKEVIAAKDAMNQYLEAEVTYNYESVEVKLTNETFASWISVDENMTPVVSLEQAKAFAKTLATKYNTANRSGVLTSPTGKQVTLQNAVLGRAVGTDAEGEQLVKEIQAGKPVSREPIFSRQETPEGQYVWGNTYIEVDITEQHMWYIVNGEIAFETDVVTGKKGKHDTPTGVYTILEMIKGKYLRGRLVNGKPSYITWVDYWMRVTWSGIGFHDAGWQSAFGGERYITNGSHGCINMPPAKAAELYKMISKGTPVAIHY